MWFQKFCSENETPDDENGKRREYIFDNEQLQHVEQNQSIKEIPQTLGVTVTRVLRPL